MKPIHIFRAGKHTAADGTPHEFSDERLRAIAESYDPAKHEAPICVGHPKDNKPAYGWIRSLEYRDGELLAHPHQVDENFEELVRDGKFKKVSASFYPAEHPSNPVGKDADYVRHIAFLGAQPPAVKGLRQAEFSDDTDGVIVVEFADVEESIQLGTVADVFRRIREWIIGRDGQEAADQVVPAFTIETLQRASEREMHAPPETTEPSYSEEEAAVTKQTDTGKGGGQGAGAEDSEPDFAERQAALERREADLAKRERELRRSEHTEFVEQLVGKGKVLPRDKDNLVEFLEAQDAETELEFAEADDNGKTKKVKKTGLAWFQEFLGNLPPAIDYSEQSAADGEGASVTAEFQAPAGYSVDEHRARVHARAKQLQADNDKLSFAEAAQRADREIKKEA